MDGATERPRFHQEGGSMANSLKMPALSVAAVLLAATCTRGQGPSIPSGRPLGSSGGTPGFETSPGSISGGTGAAGSDSILGGRPGTSVPRVPSSITRPDRRSGAPLQEGIGPPPALPLADVPLF